MNEYLFDMPNEEQLQDKKAPIKGRKRIRNANRNQIEFKISSIDDLIPETHRARDVWEFVSQLDLTVFSDNIKVLEGNGGPATLDPKIAMSLWLFATLNGIYSARQIAQLCKEHHAYIWICGGASVNYHSISDFRTQDNDKFRKLLQESIAIIWKSGIFQPEEVAQDGTRVRASAGLNSLRTEQSLERYLIEAENLIKNLEKELATNPSALSLRQRAANERAVRERKARIEKAKSELENYKTARAEECKRNHKKFSDDDSKKIKLSITDPECRNMKMATGGYRPAYNVQYATSTDKKVVVGVDVVNTQDPGTLVPMMQQVSENLAAIGCQMPSKWLADSAYSNKTDVNQASEKYPETVLYSPPMSNQKVDALSPRQGDSPAMSELRARMGTEEAEVIYKKRCSTAEFTNAVTKNRGMDEFLLKGLTKVKNMAIIFAVVHNMLRFWDLT